jgi:hypothetical protein
LVVQISKRMLLTDLNQEIVNTSDGLMRNADCGM